MVDEPASIQWFAKHGLPGKKKEIAKKMTVVYPEKKKEPKITRHEDRGHHIAEAAAQKADPHYEMSDRPHTTKGSKVYNETLAKYK